MTKRNILLVFILAGCLFLTPKKIFSLECDQEADLKKKEACLQDTLNRLGKEENTLSTQIHFMDTQIYLTGLQIEDTEQKIITTEDEINTLTSRIDGLDTSLNYLSKMLLQRIVEGYKKRSVSLFSLFFDSSNADDLFNRIKYLKTVQDNNQKYLVQVQQAKSNFEEQKQLRETKKIELGKLTQTLNQQKNSLNNQKNQKQKLLVDTQNNESIYQRLLAEAQAQLSAFKSFVVGAGAGVISENQFGNGSDGNYYSQRDNRWAYKAIGYSNENILDVGCLITSVAMTAKKLGANLTPLNIASDISRFFGNTAYMKLPWPSVSGKSYVSLSRSEVDQELHNGNYVVAGIYRSSCATGGDHFVVLTKKDGDSYTIHDPVYGPDKKFSDYYSSFCSFATFK